jgi:hypothetical protein
MRQNAGLLTQHVSGTRMSIRGGPVIEALPNKPEGRGFDSRWCLDFTIVIDLPVTLGPLGRLSL